MRRLLGMRQGIGEIGGDRKGTALRDVVAALVPTDPEQGRIEDGLLPASLFRAIYFDNRAGEVVIRGR